MKPVVITKYHEKVIWKTFAIIAAITIALVLYGKYVPTATPGKQSARCEVIDRRVNDDYDRTFRLGQIGFNLVVASIQRLIVKDWIRISVSEEIKG